MNDGKIRCEHSLYYIKLSNCNIFFVQKCCYKKLIWQASACKRKYIFKNIISSWRYPLLECNSSLFKTKRISVRKFSKNSVEQPLQSLMLTKFGLSFANQFTEFRKYSHVFLLQLDKWLIALHLMHDVVVKN